MERDPVCGMSVEPAKAAAAVDHGQKTYYFCCKSCAEKFRAAPERYLSASPQDPLPQPVQLIQLGGAKPALSQISVSTKVSAAAVGAPQAASSASIYVCPMDPEVR